MAARHRARERALQMLFQIDLTADSPDDVFVQFAERDAPDDATIDEPGRVFAEALVLGVLEHRVRLDARIESRATRWRVARMPVVDRNVLRLALYEMLLHEPALPAAVAIDEAVELAKRFGGEQSGAFVNGLLDALRRESEGGARQAASAREEEEEDPIRR
jgi:N utilization substance protein B